LIESQPRERDEHENSTDTVRIDNTVDVAFPVEGRASKLTRNSRMSVAAVDQKQKQAYIFKNPIRMSKSRYSHITKANRNEMKLKEQLKEFERVETLVRGPDSPRKVRLPTRSSCESALAVSKTSTH
jgi:uncharacterized protein with gpF-like domain